MVKIIIIFSTLTLNFTQKNTFETYDMSCHLENFRVSYHVIHLVLTLITTMILPEKCQIFNKGCFSSDAEVDLA